MKEGTFSLSINRYLMQFLLLTFFPSEYEALDLELDQINSCLDKLENWNDSLRSRMKDMLETMQKTRIEREIQTNQDDGHNGTQP